jgi:hypothetical protein
MGGLIGMLAAPAIKKENPNQHKTEEND